MTREDDIKILCIAVLNVSPSFWDNPNGGYENSCPFCYNVAYGDSKSYSREMSDIKHNHGCAYLVAKDLTTNINN